MASAQPVKRGFFPLDEELAVLPGQLTPLLQDQLAHLGTWMPFAHAAAMLTRFTQVMVSKSTAQRLTEAIGVAYEAVQLAEVERSDCLVGRYESAQAFPVDTPVAMRDRCLRDVVNTGPPRRRTAQQLR